MYGCQQVLVKKDRSLISILTFLCEEAHKLTNMGICYARQLHFKTQKRIGKYDLEKEYKTNNHYKVLYSQAAQQILRTVAESFQSYYKLLQAYREGKILDRPRLSNYRRRGMALVTYPSQALKLKEARIKVPLGKTCKRWFGLDSFEIPMPSKLNFADIKELRILPRNKSFYFEFIYEKQAQETLLNPNNILGIDCGLINWLCCVSTVGTSFIVDGKHVKSLNRWYNKQVATIKENKPQGFWNRKLALITEKRNRQMRDAINKAARLVINHCLENNIGTIVFGWNKRQKDSIKIGRKNNSEFVPIPTARLKERIAQLAEQYGIIFEEVNEAYTSQASFLDDDFVPEYGEKPQDWQSSGKRTKRGLFRTANNWYINADANSASNIICRFVRQVSMTSSRLSNVSLERVSRGVLTRPTRINIWVTAKETRSNEDL